MTGTFMTHIPYRGAGPMMQDLLAGAVDFAFDGMGTSAAQIKAGKLNFSLVAPEREVFSGLVDQVDAPGVEGDFGVLPEHAPFMTALREGVVTVFDGNARRVFEVHGGFADVTPAGLTILAEQASEVTAA